MKYKEAVKNVAPIYWDDSEEYDDEEYAAYCRGSQYGITYALADIFGKDFEEVQKDLDKAAKKWLKTA